MRLHARNEGFAGCGQPVGGYFAGSAVARMRVRRSITGGSGTSGAATRSGPRKDKYHCGDAEHHVENVDPPRDGTCSRC